MALSILIGNKIDLEGQRIVPTEEGRLTEELRKTLKAKSDFLGRVNADLYREFIIRTENLLKD
ncbi:MAG: hypothetical protein P8Y97_12315 [Candidatus Lokiarchaeota archaeon]